MHAARDVYRWDHGVLSRWLAREAVVRVDCPVCGSQPARLWTRQGEWSSRRRFRVLARRA